MMNDRSKIFLNNICKDDTKYLKKEFESCGDLISVRIKSDNQVEAGNTFMHEAARNNSLKSIVFLAKHGFDMNAKNDFGVTPLMIASAVGANHAVAMLLKIKADVNAVDHLGQNALFWAIQGSNHEAFSLLLKAKSDPLVVNKIGNTLLHMAAIFNDRAIAAELLELGLSKDSLNASGKAPLDVAYIYNSVKVIELIE